jgi:hypothetical protein
MISFKDEIEDLNKQKQLVTIDDIVGMKSLLMEVSNKH